MALIIPPGFLQAVYEFQLLGDSEQMVTTCGHEIDGPSGATGEEAPNDLFNIFASTVVGNIGGNYTLTGVTVYVGNDGPGPLVYTSTSTPVAGGTAADVVPPNTAYLLRKRTDLAGKRGRGRMYVPGVPQLNVDDVGNLSGSQVTAMQADLDDWYEELTAGVGARLYPPVVLHRSEGIGVEPPPTAITAFTCSPKVATQRRRLRP